jgi:hypothetical protein
MTWRRGFAHLYNGSAKQLSRMELLVRPAITAVATEKTGLFTLTHPHQSDD